MCDFKPGDEVVCVDAAPRRDAPFFGTIREGEVYIVSRMGSSPAVDYYPEDPIVVWVHGATNRSPGWPDTGFAPCRFRKVQRRDLTVWLATENTIEGPVRKREGVK